YRTGDLARYRPDGTIEFLHRIDHQVKIRGFRIELGEVETVLGRHPGVGQVVVVARRDEATSSNRLVAYVVSDPMSAPQPPTVGELQGFVKETLPDYMVPAAFVFLESLPLTPNRKVDRRALPAPDAGRPHLATTFVAPASAAEKALAEIWAEVLGREQVGVNDSFFELGGHSLSLMQVIARIRKLFGVEIPLRTFFEAPTVAALAPRVEAGERSELPPLKPVPRDRDLPLSFAQERLWFLAQLDPENTSYHVPHTFRISGPLDVATLERSYEALIRRHEVLHTTFPTVAGRPVQRIHLPSPLRLPVIDLSGLADEVREVELERLIRAFGHRLFDLARGPLLRAELARLGPTEHALIQSEHHLVLDGWTEGILTGDLLRFYRAFAAGEPSPLPELGIQFADFACWQREWIRGELLERQLAYWTEQLAGAPATSLLPGDRPRPPAQSYRGLAEDFLVPAALSERLNALSRGRGMTLFMTMLAAYKALLCRYGGQQDLVVGTGVANRRVQEIEGLVGMIINTLALRTELSGDPSFGELLARVREVCLGAFSHEDVPFEKVVEALRPERTLSHAPLFQTMFAFYDAPSRWIEIPGLRVDWVDAHNRSAKFDLVVIAGPPATAEEPTRVHVEWATDLYDATTIRRLWEHWLALLAGAAADPGERLSRLPLLTPAERWQLIGEWTATATDYPRETTVARLFEAQAAARPAATA
ncbi:MAG: non-ribosomal peptide synthetase, partial [bacterium]|nr:non-ribosomal peptide synthetase [bacterium]